jgi:hypothetical protein
MTDAAPALRRALAISRVVVTSPFTLWTMFVLAHL